MTKLTAQFDNALWKAYELERKNQSDLLESLRKDREQQAILARFLSDYRHKADLVDYVMDKIAEGAFKAGDDAKAFFCICADEVFFKNLQNAKERKTVENVKMYHPLFGESWWTT